MTSSEDDAVREFVARHARPYDPETDAYDRPPFASDIKEGKNDPIYNAHSYHTKVPPRSIIPLILHYTEPGALVLDPFCGSGMTGVAAILCADPPDDILQQFPELRERVGPRHAILNDLSPAASHIARNYTTPVDIDALQLEFERIKLAVKDEFDWLYGTEHYEPAIALFDPQRPEIGERLKNPPPGAARTALFETGGKRTWELISRDDVERRLGYPVTNIPRRNAWGSQDLRSVDRWLVIPATIQYTIWSDVYRCEGFVTVQEATGKVSTRGRNAGKSITRKTRVARGCGAEIVLWDVAVDEEAQTVRDDFSCPSCESPWTKPDLAFVRAVPVHTKLGFLDADDKMTRYHRRVSRVELDNLVEIEGRPLTNWYPTTYIYPHRELMSMGVTKHGVASIADFYTPRNLRALARLWAEADACRDMIVRSHLRFLLTSAFGHIERTTRYKFGRGGNSSLSGLLYIGSISVEDNILRQLETKSRQVGAGLRPLYALSRRVPDPSSAAVRRGSATQMTEIPDDSIDYIFTDPPFGGNIFYSDASLLYEAWLGEYTDEARELVFHRRSKSRRERDGYTFHTLADYALGMEAAFREGIRVLKPGRFCTVEFNNSDGAVFDAIKVAIRAVGFEIANMLLLDKDQKSFKQIKGASGDEDVVDKDVIFNLRKPCRATAGVTFVDQDLEHQVVEVVSDHLRTLADRIKQEPTKYNDDYRTTATLNSVLMNALLPKGVDVGSVSLQFIERVCSRYFRRVGQRWYLRGEAVGDSTGEALFEEETPIRGEETAISWLRQRLRSAPALIGELRAPWMRATGLLPQAVGDTLDVEQLLSDNFWRDPDTNRWREPTDEERARMSDHRALRVLHDAERFVEGSLKRQPTEKERADWIDTLYRTAAEGGSAGEASPSHRRIEPGVAYSVIVRLFHDLPADRLDSKTFSRARKQAEAASRQLKKVVAAAGGSASTPAGKTLPLFHGEGDDLK